MTTKRDTGGPAFPAMHYDLVEDEHGLSIRDYFAARALAICPMPLQKDKAEWSYRMADAMLEARRK